MSLIIKNLNYKYSEELPFTFKNINFKIDEGDMVAIIGSTGSGKSTLLQCIAGILKPEGEVICDKDIKMVFQYPEYQLFEQTVLKDVMFGLLNQNVPEKEAEEIAKKTLISVGIKESQFENSPFELSGGEKRKVAIAGILVLKPSYLLLDEPGAGLDPICRKEIFDLINKLNENGTTIIFVSHSMEEVAKYAKTIIIFNNGEVIKIGSPKQIFEDYDSLEKIGLAAPEGVYLLHELKKKGYNVDTSIYRFDDIKKCLETLL